MTTQTIQTSVGEIPSPFNWAAATVDSEPEILFLEKATDGRVTLEDIGSALDEYKRLFKAGIASPAEVLTLTRAYPDSEVFSKALTKMKIADDDALVIGGPASIELVDREGHLITTNALQHAFTKYMKNFRTRNAMVLHSDVQVGWALPAYISKGGQIFKSGVDEKGLFFITELRNDTKIASKVMEQIKEGKLKSYSIAGSAVKTQNIQKGLQNVMQVDELELAEVTVCEKGVNQGAAFDILKAEGAATSSCIDGSCLISGEHVHDDQATGVDFMFKSDGDIDFTKSFFKFMKKEGLDGESFPTLMNTQGRQDEHHQLLDKYGFPGELEPEYARYTPVVEEDPSFGAHKIPPWTVNEAGQNLGARHYDDALTPPQLGRYTKRGIVEGGNSSETPVSDLNTADAFSRVISSVTNVTAPKPEVEFRMLKSDEFLDWMVQQGNHIYKEDCPCEACFQKTADYKGTVEKPLSFLAKAVDNPFAVATAQAKKMGYTDFSEGSAGEEKRGEIAEALKKSKPEIQEIANLLKLFGGGGAPKIPTTPGLKENSPQNYISKPPSQGTFGEHKYSQRLGTPGNYTYVYPTDKPDSNVEASHSDDMTAQDHMYQAQQHRTAADTGHPGAATAHHSAADHHVAAAQGKVRGLTHNAKTGETGADQIIREYNKKHKPETHSPRSGNFMGKHGWKDIPQSLKESDSANGHIPHMGTGHENEEANHQKRLSGGHIKSDGSLPPAPKKEYPGGRKPLVDPVEPPPSKSRARMNEGHNMLRELGYPMR